MFSLNPRRIVMLKHSDARAHCCSEILCDLGVDYSNRSAEHSLWNSSFSIRARSWSIALVDVVHDNG